MKKLEKILKEIELLPELVRRSGEREDLEKLLEAVSKLNEAIAELVDNVLLPSAKQEDYHYYLFVSTLSKRGFLGRKAVWIVICDREPKCRLQCDKCKVFGNAVIISDPKLGREEFERVAEIAKKMASECGCNEVLIVRGVAK